MAERVAAYTEGDGHSTSDREGLAIRSNDIVLNYGVLGEGAFHARVAGKVRQQDGSHAGGSSSAVGKGLLNVAGGGIDSVEGTGLVACGAISGDGEVGNVGTVGRERHWGRRDGDVFFGEHRHRRVETGFRGGEGRGRGRVVRR